MKNVRNSKKIGKNKVPFEDFLPKKIDFEFSTFLLQNLKLDGKKLQFELKTPFDRVLETNRCLTLLRGLDDVRTCLVSKSPLII